MEVNKLIKLVGLEYYLSIEQREKIFKSWSDVSILIKPDKENPKDKTALEAFPLTFRLLLPTFRQQACITVLPPLYRMQQCHRQVIALLVARTVRH